MKACGPRASTATTRRCPRCLVVCRSEPEREITVNALLQARHPRRAYVEATTLEADSTSFTFYMGEWGFRRPYRVEFRWRGDDGWRGHWDRDDYTVQPQPLRFTLDPPREGYEVTLRMDGQLVYKGRFSGEPGGPEVYP